MALDLHQNIAQLGLAAGAGPPEAQGALGGCTQLMTVPGSPSRLDRGRRLPQGAGPAEPRGAVRPAGAGGCAGGAAQRVRAPGREHRPGAAQRQLPAELAARAPGAPTLLLRPVRKTYCCVLIAGSCEACDWTALFPKRWSAVVELLMRCVAFASVCLHAYHASTKVSHT